MAAIARLALVSAALLWMVRGVPALTVEHIRPAASSEIRLTPGPFAALSDAEIGKAVTFENDIDAGPCVPVLVSSRILLWIERAHRTRSRLFVVPCDQYVTTTLMRPGTVYGGASRWWFEATPADWESSPRLELRRLDPPGWNLFSNAAFCGDRMAYWAFDRDSAGPDTEVTARVRDVITDEPVASMALGRVVLETDNRGCLARPTWNEACTAVVFHAASQGKEKVTLQVR